MKINRKLDVNNQSGELNLNYRYGLRYTSFYKKWSSLKSRCINPKLENYKSYGGRGIKVCDEWLEFINFRDNMYASYLEHVKLYGEHNTTIERKNVNGDYNKDNCTWVTEEKQHYNTTTNKWFTAISPNGEVYFCRNQRCFARKFNLNRVSIRACIGQNWGSYKGWDIKNFHKITLNDQSSHGGVKSWQ